MTLKECYQILNVDQSASLEEVKRAYRRRAFELHPDLNPDVSDANRQFQRLNEAYVILNRLVAARETAAKESAAKGHAGQEAPRPGPRWYDWGFSFGGKKDEQTAEESPTNEERQAQREERRAQREEAYREEIRREEARQRDRKREEERRQEERRKNLERERAERAERERSQAEQARSEQAQPEQPRSEQARQEAEQPRPERPRPERPQQSADSERPRPERPHAGKAASGDNMYAEQQEVLRDILNDDFARRVFEDIYSEIRKKTPPPGREERRVKREEPSRSQTMKAESVQQKTKSGLPFGLDQFKLDFSSGVGNTVKGWLRSQIDEEQTIRLPATGLYPGARVRLQIRRGLSEELTTLEVTLPPDFVAGKPVRLRGMGKKLGSMQGDLYLTVLAR